MWLKKYVAFENEKKKGIKKKDITKSLTSKFGGLF